MSIYHFFYGILSELFGSGDWTGIVLGCLLSLVILVLVGLVLWGLFYAVDSWFLPSNEADGVITSKNYTPATMFPVSTTVSNGNGGFNTITTMSHVPASWYVDVELNDGHCGSMGVEMSYYKTTRIGERVTAEFVVGRLSRRIYIQSLSR